MCIIIMYHECSWYTDPELANQITMIPEEDQKRKQTQE